MFSDCKCSVGCDSGMLSIDSMETEQITDRYTIADAASNETSPVDTLTPGLAAVDGKLHCSADPSIHKV